MSYEERLHHLDPEGKRVYVHRAVNGGRLRPTLAAVEAACADLLDDPAPFLDAEDWYEDSHRLVVTGWRPVLDSDQEWIAFQADTRSKGAREQLRRLRREFPHLFDGQGRPLEDAPVVEAEAAGPEVAPATGWVGDPDLAHLRLLVGNSVRAHPENALAYVVKGPQGWLLVKTGTVARRDSDERLMRVRFPDHEIRVVPVEAWS